MWYGGWSPEAPSATLVDTSRLPDGQPMELVNRTNGGILMNLHNIYANERNDRQKVNEFLKQIPFNRVWEIHLAGGFGWQGYWLDAHSGAIPDRLCELALEMVPNLPSPESHHLRAFSSFLPVFGRDRVLREVERIRQLWNSGASDDFRKVRVNGPPHRPRPWPNGKLTLAD